MKYIICLWAFVIGLVSCQKEKESEDKATRTVLVYMVASNLNGNMQGNLEDMISVASQKNLNNGNLIVYYSDKNKNAELFQIKEGKGGVVTRHHIRNYEGQSAVTPEVMHQIIGEVFAEYPAEGYGLILSSHGTSWLPSKYTNMLRSFGEEEGKHMEIYELEQALRGYYFDFILFDACSMAGIECAYELKDKADYIVASPSETMAYGFPYGDMLPYLFTETAALDKVALAFRDFYTSYRNPYGCISVIETSGLEELTGVVRDILSTVGEEAVYALPLSDLQTLSYITFGTTKLYDLQDMISRLATAEQFQSFKTALGKVIKHKYTTDKIYCSGDRREYDVKQFSGLSIYPLQKKYTELNTWYKSELQWSKAIYP
ncbi:MULTISPECIES: clostripain-related cysteine peptidase [unclassified Parabacteroides]|uniref:clostripain-related cysteine peptidase n=1 Tax=unclassified Parabacteroides TaxID=2649774 RepID=UPI0013D2B08E|nr:MULTISPECIES: clostripain-related cysteine peptidase [unclassified Parabacteroides]